MMPGLSMSDLPWPTEANRIGLHARGIETERETAADATAEDALRSKPLIERSIVESS